MTRWLIALVAVALCNPAVAQEKKKAAKTTAKKTTAKKETAKKETGEKETGKKKAGKKKAGKKETGKKKAAKKKAKPKPKAVLAYEATRKEYDRIDKRIRGIVNKYRAARNQAEERRVLLIEYRSLAKKLSAQFPKLRDAAAKAYSAAPNEYPAVTEVMLGIANDNIRRDRFADAQKILEMMISKKCAHRAVHPLSGRAAYCLNEFAKAEKHFTQAKKLKIGLSFEDQEYLKDIPVAMKRWAREKQLQKKDAKTLPQATITVRLDDGANGKPKEGTIVIALFENEAPGTVGNFISLAEQKKPKPFYDGLVFHRVIGGFMAQTGCPLGDGTSGPGYNIYCECVKKEHRHHFRGSISMAKGTDLNSGGSQFFITFRRTAHLDGKHTVFGRVIKGMDIVDEIRRGDAITGRAANPNQIITVKISNKRKGSTYKPNQVPKKPDENKKGEKKKKAEKKK